MSKIMAVNAGSSSLKYQLIQMPEEKVLCGGIVERIGLKEGIFSVEVSGVKHKENLVINDHEQAVKLTLVNTLLKFYEKANYKHPP